MEDYINFFKDIDSFIRTKTDKMQKVEICVVGYVALVFAGLTSMRGTKDVDALRTDALLSDKNVKLVESLEKEFGKKSPGLYRHGIYLDFVPMSIIWLPPKPEFKDIVKLEHVVVKALNPTDVCVSKFFSYLKSHVRRGNDRSDIIYAFEYGIVSFENFIKRLDEALPRYEAHAEAPTIFPMALKLIKELAINYVPSISLKYKMPSWMLNM